MQLTLVLDRKELESETREVKRELQGTWVEFLPSRRGKRAFLPDQRPLPGRPILTRPCFNSKPLRKKSPLSVHSVF